MALKGCCSCIKYLFVLINLIICVLGLALLGVAVWLYVDSAEYLHITQEGDNYYSGTYILMGMGILMALIGFLGCIGACRESPCMLGTFFALVLLLLVAEIATIVWAHLNRDKLSDVLRRSVDVAVKQDYRNHTDRSAALDAIQQNLHCCGAKGPNDWASSRYNGAEPNAALEIGTASDAKTYKVPETCCRVPPEDARCTTALSVVLGSALPDVFYKDGCAKKLEEFLMEHSSIIMGVIIAVILVELLAMVVSLSVCIGVLRSSRDYKH